MAKFYSRCPNQVLCIKPARTQVVDGIRVPVPGEHIRFENGVFTTNEKKEIDFLRKHPFYGNRIYEEKSADKATAAAGE